MPPFSGKHFSNASILRPCQLCRLIRHSMNLVKRTADILNAEQVPITIVDQLLFTIAKTNPVELDSKSRRRLVHCDFWRTSHPDGSFQDYWQSSRQQWVDGCISSSQCWYGRFISLHLLCDPDPKSPPDHSKQLVLSSGKSLYCSSLGEECNQLSLEDRWLSRTELYPRFKFWLLILLLEFTVLVYVRAIREGDFKLYVDALTKIFHWFFALDHTNYAYASILVHRLLWICGILTCTV